MKIVKSVLSFLAFFLASLVIIISFGSILCKYTNLRPHSMIQIFGYVSFFWILAVSAIVLLLFLLVRRLNAALSYLGVIIIFVFLLNDFSFSYFRKRIPEHTEAYDSIKVIVLTPEKLEYLRTSLPSYTIISDNGHDLSILSKHPVISYKIVDLPTFVASLSSSNDIEKIIANGVHRSFVHAVIDVNGTPVNVLSLRLLAGRPKDHSIGECIKWGKYLLNSQDEELAAFTDYLKTVSGPIIFGGDLNVTPNTQIIHQLNQYAEDTYLQEHMFGAFTFKLSFPTMRLDYLFHSKDVISKKSELVKMNTVLSDHFPVRAVFLIPRIMK